MPRAVLVSLLYWAFLAGALAAEIGATKPRLAIPNLMSLGLAVHESSEGKKSQIELSQLGANESTQFIHDHSLRTQTIRHFQDGQLVEETIKEPYQVTHIDYQSRPQTKTIRTADEQGGGLIVLYTRSPQTDWKKSSEETFGPKALMACNNPVSDTLLNQSVGRFLDDGENILDFSVRTAPRQPTRLGHNVRSIGCGGLRPDGNHTLAEDISESLNQGLGCMRRVSDAAINSTNGPIRIRGQQLRRMARTVLGNFIVGANSMFTFRCFNPIPQYPEAGWREARAREPANRIGHGTHAFAADCHYPAGTGREELESMIPGIQLNTQYFSSTSERNRRSTIFHELLHHAGLLHGRADDNNADWVYSLEFCCFGTDEANPLPNLDRIASEFSCLNTLSASHGTPRATPEAINRTEAALPR